MLNKEEWSSSQSSWSFDWYPAQLKQQTQVENSNLRYMKMGRKSFDCILTD